MIMAVSVVKKLERCEKVMMGSRGSSRHGEATIEHYHVVKYKIKIKDFSSTPIKLMKYDRVVSLLPSSSESPTSSPPFIFLQHSSPHDPDLPSSRSPSQLHQKEENSSSPSSPWILQRISESEADSSSVNLSSFKQPQILEEIEDLTTSPLTLQPSSSQNREEEESSSTKAPCKQQENSDEAWLEGMARLCKLQDSTLQEEEEKSWTRLPWKLQKQEKKAGKTWELEKMECECCGMEEECTRGYEERVRGELCGHWLCGLCGEAVREERKRLGGAGGVSMQAALAAHMEPCRRFSSRARSKASPLPSDVAVPHAVCRLLRRHLSTPAPSPRPSASLARSSSSLPKP